MDLYEKLKQPLDAKAVKPHPTKTYLSSIKAIYVTERFNDVFGVGKWTQKVQTEHVNHDTGMVIVKVIFEVPELSIYYESFGGNDNGGIENKNFDLGDAYKGATTDALTKIGSYLGVAIDVFKGQNDNKKEDDNKSWLNIYKKGTKDFTDKATQVYQKMQSGHYKDINSIRNDYKVSKVDQSIIESWFAQLKKAS